MKIMVTGASGLFHLDPYLTCAHFSLRTLIKSPDFVPQYMDCSVRVASGYLKDTEV
jgi:hypothetical protein